MQGDARAGLAEDQARVIDVLQHGPSAYPESLFAGPSHRVLLGLKAHANTISHARLIALEDTFPRTLTRIGLQQFNTLSRAFIELEATRVRKLMQLGEGFPAFLSAQGLGGEVIQLARVEWAWLQSYHAADAPALQMADLAGLDEAALLGLPVVLHPACNWVDTDADLAGDLPELAVGGDARTTRILITRPEAAVLLHALDEDRAAVLDILAGARLMSNLLEGAIERLGEARALPCVFALIGAGTVAAQEA